MWLQPHHYTPMFSVISFVFVLQRSAAGNPQILQVFAAATGSRLHHNRNEGLGY
jgi:hypothetical protein